MKIGSIKENLDIEQRVAITPEIIKKYKSLDLKIILPKGYGEHLGITDQEFTNEGAEILDSDEKVLSEADVVLQMNLIDEKNFEKLKNESSNRAAELHTYVIRLLSDRLAKSNATIRALME